MRLRWLSYCFALICSTLCANVFAQDVAPNVVQVNGIIMTPDSQRVIPNVTVLVKSQNRGVISSHMGVFTIVCFKGDTLQFSEIGFRPKEVVIPKDIKGEYYSLIEPMVQDTFYLPETIVRPLPTKKEFEYAFTHWAIPNDQYEIARRNTDKYTLRAIAYTLPRDGRESQAMYQMQAARDAAYYGQMKPMNIFNPLAWADFFQAWKRGDFRNQQPY
ncbi:MAG: carboxypeptidase-like regulatory domain-containing protein [Flavipsychrobacter sp.]